MEPQLQHNLVWVFVLVALIVGLGGGYYYGNSSGKLEGREVLLAEQEAQKGAEKKAAQERVTQIANPFADAEEVNPLEGVYKNPFDGVSANPFRQ